MNAGNETPGVGLRVYGQAFQVPWHPRPALEECWNEGYSGGFLLPKESVGSATRHWLCRTGQGKGSFFRELKVALEGDPLQNKRGPGRAAP